jgi:ribosomal protein S1
LHQNHIAAAVKYKEGAKKRTKDILDKKSKIIEGFEVGETLKCNIRIKEFNYFDNIPLASTLEGINESAVLSWDTIKGGITVQGTIREAVDDNYIVVDLNDKIFGRVYKYHLSDAPQKHINKKIKESIGKKMTFKTWSSINDKEILELTKKESIVKSTVFVPSDIEDPKIVNGVKITGVLKAKDDKGYIIEYYNQLRGFLPFESLEKYNKKFAFQRGALIEAYLLFKTRDGLSLTVSEEESINFKPKKGQYSGLNKQKVYIQKVIHLERGNKVKGVICNFNKSCSYPLTVKLSDSQMGIIFFTDLGLKDNFNESELERIFEVGSVIDVYVKTPKEGEGKVECSLIAPEQEHLSKYDVGEKVFCRHVKFKNGFGATVQLTPTKYGFIDV